MACDRKKLLGVFRSRRAEREPGMSDPTYHGTGKYYERGCYLRPDVENFHKNRKQDEAHAESEKVGGGEPQELGDDATSSHI